MNFIKMHGCGNDYIFIDCFNGAPARPKQLAIRLSDRNTGIGGDGLVLIERSQIAHARMRIFNTDGTEAQMCGNAIRCVGRYLFESGTAPFTNLNIETRAGVRQVEVLTPFFKGGAGVVGVKPTRAGVFNVRVDMGPVTVRRSLVDVGNPHRPIQCDDVDAATLGPHLGNRVNTEYFQIIGPNHIKMRVYERGSGETRACGTGACAVAAFADRHALVDPAKPVTVDMLGGTLSIELTPDTTYMTGPAVIVFTGVINDK